MPTSTARRTRSSSQSISSSARARLFRVAPELGDPVGSLEVGEHQDVEQLGAGSRAEGVQAFSKSALKIVGSHGRRLRGPTVPARVGVLLHVG